MNHVLCACGDPMPHAFEFFCLDVKTCLTSSNIGKLLKLLTSLCIYIIKETLQVFVKFIYRANSYQKK